RPLRHSRCISFWAQSDTPVRDQEFERSQINLCVASDGSKRGSVSMFVDIGKYLVARENDLIPLDLVQTGRRHPLLTEKTQVRDFIGRNGAFDRGLRYWGRIGNQEC